MDKVGTEEKFDRYCDLGNNWYSPNIILYIPPEHML